MSVLSYAEKLKAYPARRLYCGIVCAAERIGVGSSTVGNVCVLFVDVYMVKEVMVHKITVALIVIGCYGIVFVKIV